MGVVVKSVSVFGQAVGIAVLLLSSNLAAAPEPATKTQAAESLTSPNTALLADPSDSGFEMATTPLVPTSYPVTLPAGTPVFVTLDSELATQTNIIGDNFSVTVAQNVLVNNMIAIPKGAKGVGEVTFVTKKGGFGKPGIIGIALRTLNVNGQSIILDGRFREEGGNRDGVTAATMFAVGVFSGFIQGKPGTIPAGRGLKGRVGEDITINQPPVDEKPVPQAATPSVANPEQQPTMP